MIYSFKRLLQAVPVVLGVMTLTFILMYLVPGDPVLAMVGEHFDAATVANLRRQLVYHYYYSSYNACNCRGDDLTYLGDTLHAPITNTIW